MTYKIGCSGCEAIYKVPAYYVHDMSKVPMIESCPCGFDPINYHGCIKEEPYKTNHEKMKNMIKNIGRCLE